MDDWPHSGLEDDLRPRMSDAMAAGRPFALVTVFAADGGPRGVGAQMVVTEADYWGFVSGGCIEADVALHARETLADGEPRRLVYGRGSPWIDTRLPCGGRLDLLTERVEPDDPVIRDLIAARDERRSLRYRSDGQRRRCDLPLSAPPGAWEVDHVYTPPQRLIVIGSDPIAMAIAGMGARMGWASVIIWSGGPPNEPGLDVTARRERPAIAVADLAPDPQTAIAIATHEIEDDEAAIIAALQSEAGYIGVLGARRRIPDRTARLRARGVDERQIERLHMPIGLAIGAAAPWEIAVSVCAEIVAVSRRAVASG